MVRNIEVVKLERKILALQDGNKIYEWNLGLSDNVSG